MLPSWPHCILYLFKSPMQSHRQRLSCRIPTPIPKFIDAQASYTKQMPKHLHVMCTQSPVYLASSSECLQHLLQCKYCANHVYTILFKQLWHKSIHIQSRWLFKHFNVRLIESVSMSLIKLFAALSRGHLPVLFFRDWNKINMKYII